MVSLPDMKRTIAKPWSIALLVCLALIAGVHAANLDDRFHYAWQAWNNSEAEMERVLWLPGYRADIDGAPIEGVADNASGVTYDHDRESLWIVVNSPPSLVELDMNLRFQRKVELKNFKDTEGVAYLGGSEFAIVDERHRAVMVGTIDEGTHTLDRHQLRELTLYPDGSGNNGLEGVAVDRSEDRLYVVLEREPGELYKVDGFLESGQSYSVERAMDATDVGVDDLSGLHFDAATRHLLVLSEASRELAEVDLSGNTISSMALQAGLGGLKESVPQAEGVTMDAAGRLYVVSEPNLIYRFSR